MKRRPKKPSLAWPFRCIELIAEYRVSDRFQVYANLVRPSRFGMKRKIRKIFCAFQKLIFCYCFAERPSRARFRRPLPEITAAFADRFIDNPLFFFYPSIYDCMVCFFNHAVLKLLFEKQKGFLVLRDDHNAGCVAVETVHNAMFRDFTACLPTGMAHPRPATR